MEFVKLARTFHLASSRSKKNNDFFVDRLSHRITTNLLLIFILLSTFRRLLMSPINCWVPAELSRYAEFMEQYCWLKGTYYVDQTYDHNMLTITARNENILQYYQWVYLFLSIQAFLFYFPRIIWTFTTQKILDIDLFNMIDASRKFEHYKCDSGRILKFLRAGLTNNYSDLTTVKEVQIITKVEQKMDQISEIENEKDELVKKKLEKSMPLEKDYMKFAKFRFSSGLITFIYIGIKFLYLFVAVIQIVIMNNFLTNGSNTYGSEIYDSIVTGNNEIKNNTDSRIFPRITICDVRTKELGTDHTYTIQCVLSFNLFNERIYAFIWFWIFFVVIPFTVIDLVNWLITLCVRGTEYRYKFIKNRVKIYEKITTTRQKFLLRLFTEYAIGVDGCFFLKLLEHNSNALVVSELIKDMWIQFKIEQKH